ncbi:MULTISPECIES: hypothetical protein [Nocardia]|uniref:hypothetical protein n=1 Tax=Nocardia TaxID=1817 RepID=UPI00245568A0|nr:MULTISPECIES: hypothetical protein [Nocardia]
MTGARRVTGSLHTARKVADTPAAVATPIEPAYTRASGTTSHAVRCRECRAVQGNHFVGEETLNRVMSRGIDGLDTLGLAPSSTRRWQLLVHDPSVAWMGPVPTPS